MKCLCNEVGVKCDEPVAYVLLKDEKKGICELHADMVAPELRKQSAQQEEKPRFEMLSRADYEIACKELDSISAQISGEVAMGTMDGIAALAWWRELDRRREELKRRLFITGMILSRRQRKAPKGDNAPIFAEVPADKGRALSDKGIAIVRWNWDKDKGTSTQVRIERSNV